jgi:hypothetical protein
LNNRLFNDNLRDEIQKIGMNSVNFSNCSPGTQVIVNIHSILKKKDKTRLSKKFLEHGQMIQPSLQSLKKLNTTVKEKYLQNGLF